MKGTPFSHGEHHRLEDLRRRIRDAQHTGKVTAAGTLAMLMEMVELLDWLLEAQDQTDEAMQSILRPTTFAVPRSDFTKMLLGHAAEEPKGEEEKEVEGELHGEKRRAGSPYMAAGHGYL